MKKKHVLFPAAAASILFGLAVYLAPSDFDVYGQVASNVDGKQNIAPATQAVKLESKGNIAAFSRAAAENAKLRNSLQWTFGGKAQTGWGIYVPLISHTIGMEAGADSTDFAFALSKWQAKSGLVPTGVLDTETLQSFVKYWQSRRLGRSGLSGTLLSAPIAEFYDPSRSPDLLQLEQETYAAYRKMIAAAAKDLSQELKLLKSGELAPEERFLRIISAYRSPEYQASLRKKEPNAGRAALARNSPHSTGQALDIYVGGEPTITKDANRLIQVQTPAYKWLVKNAHRFGFYPYFYEPWHWEYVPRAEART